MAKVCWVSANGRPVTGKIAVGYEMVAAVKYLN
jgi:hypothetical protein